MLPIHNRTMKFMPTSKDASGFFVASYHTIFSEHNQKCDTRAFEDRRIIYIPTVKRMELSILEFKNFLGDITISQINVEVGQEFGNITIASLLEETIRDCYNYFSGTPPERITQAFNLWYNDIPVMQLTLHHVQVDANAPNFSALFDSIKLTVSTQP